MSSKSGQARTAQDLNPFDQISREHWSIATAAVFVGSWPPEVLHAVVAAGEDEFVRVSRHYLAGHAFYTEDYRRIFRIIERASVLNPADKSAFLGQLVVSATH